MTLTPGFRIHTFIRTAIRVAALLLLTASLAAAQQARLTGTVRDETSAALPGVLVELHSGTAAVRHTQSDERGQYPTPSRPGAARSHFRSSISRR